MSSVPGMLLIMGNASIEILQINLHHCHEAVASLCHRLTKMQTKITLIQEPYVYKERIRGLDMCGKLYYADKSPRAAVLISNDVKAWPLDNYTTRDMAAVRTSWTKGDVIFASVYMAHDRECPPKELDSLVGHCEAKNLPLIIGTDCNAHHPAWGSTNINPRGDQLLEYVLASKLHVLNKGSSPTFVVANRSEVLDITLASNSIL